ncbi:MAG: oligopeptidase A [Gammaproteobacteria bacterium]|nr:oligopeptidase A [Gammaproteobacteria bacterium]
MTNPLLEDTILPAFSSIKHEHIKVAVEKQLNENRQHLKSLLSTVNSHNWKNTIEPLAKQGDKLSRLWSPVGHINAVVNSKEFREQHDACLPLLSEYSSEFGQNKDLYKAYQQVAANNQLTAIQRKIIDDDLLDFRLAGVDLEENDQVRFREIKSRLSELGSQFSNHVLDATMAWSKHFTGKSGLEGLPDSALAAAEAAAKEKDQEGYLLTLDIPCYLAVMTYAKDIALRKKMYKAYSTRASDQQPEHSNWDNAPIIKETLALRHEMAELLGFKNYAEYSVAKKMAKDPKQVINFLEQLAGYSLEKGKQELEALTQYANQIDGVTELKPWDVAFYSEKLREQKYDISQEELRPWFPENQVLEGLFEITSRLYDVEIKERNDIDKWHEDVQFFDIYIVDKSNENQKIGSFYLDLYARSHKRGGAWMDSCRDRMLLSDEILQLPVAYLTCNFNAPIGDKQALFTHDEVVTLFHEFGHGLHHLMTQIDEIQVSGINGVAWDAVELPSQFMENFCYEKESLSLMARHVDTKEPLSERILQKLNDARQFQAAMQMLRQLEFSLFDFRLHLEYSASDENENSISKVLKSVRDQVSVLQPPEWNRFENGFSHIFAGGYAAGYYSYKWAEVLSADVWSYFEEQGIFNKKSGEHFLKEILSQGGSKEAMALFVNFRGREPSVEPLLVQQGISKNN